MQDDNYVVLGRTTGGWRSTPTIERLSAEAALVRHEELSRKYPQQIFDILRVYMAGGKVEKVTLEAVPAPLVQAEAEVLSINKNKPKK